MEAAESKPVWWLAAAALWVGMALWMYTPFRARPYDVVDFFDFLPLLRESTSLLDAFGELTAHYAQQGRFNVGVFAILSVKWALFGENMLGWQLFRFAEMCLLGWLVFRLLRTLRASYFGAFAASVLVLASPSARVSWMKMSVAEPTGTILLLVLMLLMLRESDRLVSWGRLLLAGLLVLTLGLVKELFLASVIVPAIVISLLTRPPRERHLGTLIRSRRLWVIGIACVLVAIPVLFIAGAAPTTAYSRRYGVESMSAASILMPLITTLFPFAPSPKDNSLPLLVAVCCYVVLLVAGWGLLLRKDNRTSDTLLLFALGVGLPLSGAMIYAPWPTYALMYALPFQVGTAVLVGHTITALQRYVPRSVSPTVIGGIAVAAIMTTAAHGYARFIDRSLRMSRDLAVYVGRLEPTSAVRLEVCPGLSRDQWADYGQIVRRYSTSLGLRAPQVIDAECSDARAAITHPDPTPRIVMSDGPLQDRSGVRGFVYEYGSLDWAGMRLQRKALVVTLVELPPP
jgi:hypothetical protein